MNVKLLLVLTMVLCAFCVFPVNAYVYSFAWGSGYQTVNIGNITESEVITVDLTNPDDLIPPVQYIVNDGNPILFPDPLNFPYQITVPIRSVGNSYLDLRGYLPQYYPSRITFIYNIVEPSEPPTNDYDIDIDLQENPIFELGVITSLDQTFDIGSSSGRIVKEYTGYITRNCNIEDLQKNYVKISLDKDFSYAEIYLAGYALRNNVQSDFTTKAIINYTYQQTADIQCFIQTYDYQNGNLLSGVNMSVYELIDHGDYAELGNLIYSSKNSESQTILQLKSSGIGYFIKNELIGYFAVKNEEYPYINNEYGYWYNPTLTDVLRLYYSKLDPTAQYNANFIVQDVNNNGVSGVSVTMDNAVTKITNSIGGISFNNVSAGVHTFTFVKNGYQSAQRTIDIQMQYATFTQTLFKDNQIVQPTVSPTAYPTVQPTVQPTISPIEKPANIADSVKYGLSKIFGVNSLDTINLVFALMLILFPAVIGGVITNQALGFIAGGMMGFVFALAIGLIPIWVFFAMVMFSVIYLVLTRGTGEGF